MMLMLRGAAATALLLTAACATSPMMAGAGMAGGARVSYGGFQSPESATYDPINDRYYVTSAGADVFGPSNDGYISLVGPDGALIEPRWASSGEDRELISPLGTALHGGLLYVCDRTSVRLLDAETGMETGVYTVEGASFLNDVAVAADGTVYVTNTGDEADPATWRVYRITPEGTASVFAEGEVIARPNGIDLDANGDVVVVGLGTANVSVFSAADGALKQTFELPVQGNDGLVVLPDAIIVSSVFTGTVYEIDRATGAASLLAEDVATAASIGYDPVRDRIVVPQLQAHAVTFLPR